MFHLIITIVYTIPNIYLFFRVKQLFISKPYRRFYIPIYLFLALIYPITQTFSHRDMNLLMHVLSGISGYLLPFFLYLFLLVLLFDLLLLINLAVRIVPAENRKKYSFRLFALSSLILVSALAVVAGIINLNTIRTSAYRIEVHKRQAKIEHLRIVFVSDIHIQQNTRLNFIKQLVSKVNTLQPDLMLYGGDMVEGDSRKEATAALESLLRSVQATYGSFGVSGNHEYYGGDGQHDFFRESGIILLADTVVFIDSSFYLAGRNDEHIHSRETIQELIGTLPLDIPIILLDHRPTELQEVSLTGADMQFSGHTHNGQLFPINLITRTIYELSWGYKKIRNTHFFVSSGLRLWGPQVKTAGKSEIMLVDVYFTP